MKEADLYPPIQAFFEEKGYTVQGEVKDCDIALLREDQLILIELKLRFNLELVFQAIDRQTISESVFIALPRTAVKESSKRYRDMMQLIRRLDLGLILVALDSPLQHVEIVRIPSKTARQTKRGARREQQILDEIAARRFTLAVGGVTGEKIPTAYREDAIRILCTLAQLEQASAAELHQEYGCTEKAYAIVSRNYYRWFQRLEHGIYGVSKTGMKFLKDEEEDFREIVSFYNDKAETVIQENGNTNELREEPPC